MSSDRARLILRADAVFGLVAGVVLLLAPITRLYDVLDLPEARPAVLVQMGGALALGFSYLLWVAPRDPLLTRHVSLAAALTNALGAVVAALWLGFRREQLTIGGFGAVLLLGLTLTLAVFAVAEARLAQSGVPHEGG